MTDTQPTFESLAGQARRTTILALLRDNGVMRHTDIRREVNAEKSSSVSNALYQLKNDELIEHTDDGWQLATARADVNERPERAGTGMNAGPDHRKTAPTGDKEDDPSPAAGGDEPDNRPGVSETEFPDATIRQAGSEIVNELCPPVDGLLQVDPARVGILSDGTLILQTDDGQTIEVAMLGAMRAYKLMHTNQMWLRDLWEAEAQ